MNTVDIILLIFFLLGAYYGYKRGFLGELFLLVAFVLGIFLSFKFMGAVMSYLRWHFHGEGAFLPFLSFAIIFVVVVLLVIFIGRQLKQVLDRTFFGKVDSIIGAFLGIIKYAFIASVLFWFTEKFTFIFPKDWMHGSRLYPYVSGFAQSVSKFLGEFIPFFKQIF